MDSLTTMSESRSGLPPESANSNSGAIVPTTGCVSASISRDFLSSNSKPLTVRPEDPLSTNISQRQGQRATRQSAGVPFSAWSRDCRKQVSPSHYLSHFPEPKNWASDARISTHFIYCEI